MELTSQTFSQALTTADKLQQPRRWPPPSAGSRDGMFAPLHKLLHSKMGGRAMAIKKLADFAELENFLKAAKPTRTIDRVIVHHFWQPSAQDWKGKATLEGVRKTHMSAPRNWSDIGYQLIVGPD